MGSWDSLFNSIASVFFILSSSLKIELEFESILTCQRISAMSCLMTFMSFIIRPEATSLGCGRGSLAAVSIS